MAEKKNNTKKVIVPKMLSIREDQYDRIIALAEKEERSYRAIVQRMLDMYEGKKDV